MAAGSYENVWPLDEISILKVGKDDAFDDVHGLRGLAIGRSFDHPNLRFIESFDLVNVYTDDVVKVELHKIYYAGQPLADYDVMNRCDTDLRMRKIVLYQVLRALAVLHRYNIVHGDVKSANVILRKVSTDGKILLRAMLDDYGMFCFSGEHQLVSSTDFRAPELLCKNIPVTTASDIWSVGMIACQMLGVFDTVAPHTDADSANVFQEIHGITVGQTFNGCDPYLTIDHTKRLTLASLVQQNQTTTREESQFVFSCLCALPSKRPSASTLLRSPYFADVIDEVEVALPAPNPPFRKSGFKYAVPSLWLDNAVAHTCCYSMYATPRTRKLAIRLLKEARAGMKDDICEVSANDTLTIGQASIALAMMIVQASHPLDHGSKRPKGVEDTMRRGARWLLTALGGHLLSEETLNFLRT